MNQILTDPNHPQNPINHHTDVGSLKVAMGRRLDGMGDIQMEIEGYAEGTPYSSGMQMAYSVISLFVTILGMKPLPSYNKEFGTAGLNRGPFEAIDARFKSLCDKLQFNGLSRRIEDYIHSWIPGSGHNNASYTLYLFKLVMEWFLETHLYNLPANAKPTEYLVYDENSNKWTLTDNGVTKLADELSKVQRIVLEKFGDSGRRGSLQDSLHCYSAQNKRFNYRTNTCECISPTPVRNARGGSRSRSRGRGKRRSRGRGRSRGRRSRRQFAKLP